MRIDIGTKRLGLQMSHERTSVMALALVTTLMGAGCDARGSKPRAEGKTEAAARVVQVAPVALRPMDRKITALGSLAAHDQATLSAKVAGRLEAMKVDLGSVVRKGDLLAVIEQRDYELKLRQAEAMLAQSRARLGLALEGTDDHIDPATASTVKESQARLDEALRNRDRVLRLSEQGVLATSELEAAEAQYKVADNQYQEAMSEARTRQATLLQRRVEFEIAKQQLADTKILAPYDGAIQERLANLGEYLIIGAPIVRLVRLDPLRLRLEVPEREAANIRSNQTVRLTVAGDTAVYEGRITRVSPAISEQNRMLVVEADVRHQGSLRPGAFARAEIVTTHANAAVAIPVKALVTFAGIEKVFVVENHKAVERPVTSARREAEFVEIVAGIKAGEVVVLEPGNLQTGQPVVVAQ